VSLLRAILGRAPEQRMFEASSIIGSAGSVGSTISQDTSTRIIAVFRAVQILADTVATLPVDVLQRRGGGRFPAARPDWLDAPDPDDPSITRVDHFSQVMWSQALDGNSFTLALPNVYDVASLHVMDPTKITVLKGPRYRLATWEQGKPVEVGPDQMIHIARSRKAGSLRGLSPIDEAALALGTNRSAQQFSNKVFRNGAYMSGYVQVPGPLEDPTLQQIKGEIEAQYGGDNQMKPGVFANGAEWKIPQLSLEQLQFIELQKLGRSEIADLFGIPPHLLAITEPGTMSYRAVDAVGIDFEAYTIRPYIERIEAAYRRLIPGGFETYLKFNTKGLLRADFKTRSEGYALLAQNKIYDIDEIRAFEDEPPFGGDRGGPLETPNNNFAPARQTA
jgi:HK97 family phage portal protein